MFPWQHHVEGERVFTSEFRGGLDKHAVVVRDPDPRDLALPASAEFAGDLVAYKERAPGQQAEAIGARLVVAEWRTGVRRNVTDLPKPIEQLALRPEGRVALTLADSDGVYEVRPGTARDGGSGALVGIEPRGDDGDTTWDDVLVLPRAADREQRR